MSKELSVLLNETPVGVLRTTAGDGCEFELLESYKDASPRPTLGQTFLDDLDSVHHVRGGVPPWFANLLPEGALLDRIADKAGVHHSRKLHLLALLGEDLPGAVRVSGSALQDEPEGTAATTSIGASSIQTGSEPSCRPPTICFRRWFTARQMTWR